MPLDDEPVIIDDQPSPEEEKLEKDMKPLLYRKKYQSWMKVLVAHVRLVWSN